MLCFQAHHDCCESHTQANAPIAPRLFTKESNPAQPIKCEHGAEEESTRKQNLTLNGAQTLEQRPASGQVGALCVLFKGKQSQSHPFFMRTETRIFFFSGGLFYCLFYSNQRTYPTVTFGAIRHLPAFTDDDTARNEGHLNYPSYQIQLVQNLAAEVMTRNSPSTHTHQPTLGTVQLVSG